MDEARRVLERLERIESLKESGATARDLLTELRALLREGEEWLEAEGAGTESAGRALTSLKEAIHAAGAHGRGVATPA